MGKQNKQKTGGAVANEGGYSPKAKKGLADKQAALRSKASCADHAYERVSRIFEPLSKFEHVLKETNAAIVLVKALRGHKAAKKLRKIEKLLGDLVFAEPLRDMPGMRESQLAELRSIATRKVEKLERKVEKAEAKGTPNATQQSDKQ